jgi:hypothetical protein
VSKGNFSERIPKDFEDFLLPPWLPPIFGTPYIDNFDPKKGQIGDQLIIYGQNLAGARIFFGKTKANVITYEKNKIIIEVPKVSGSQVIEAQNFFGSYIATKPFQVVEPSMVGPQGFTFRGDAIYHGASVLSSIVPSSLNQEYLVLMVLPQNLSVPTGTTEGARFDCNPIAKLMTQY